MVSDFPYQCGEVSQTAILYLPTYFRNHLAATTYVDIFIDSVHVLTEKAGVDVSLIPRTKCVVGNVLSLSSSQAYNAQLCGTLVEDC